MLPCFRCIIDNIIWKILTLAPTGVDIRPPGVFRRQWKTAALVVAHFSQILLVIATSIMDDIIHDHPGLRRCKFGHVTAVRPCDIITGHEKVFLPIASHRKELQRRAWSHYAQLIKMHRMIYNIHVDLEVTLRFRDLRSTFDLDLMRSTDAYSDSFQREDLDGARWCDGVFALARLVQKLWAKKVPLSSSATIFTFLPLWRHFWPDLKMTLVKIVDLVRPYPIPLTACL